LDDFNCSYNQLTYLPTLNENLEDLNCSCNQLTYLPVLNEKLECLNLKENPIYQLIPYNGIKTLRQKIQILTNFKHLYFSLKFKNPFRRWLWELVREPKIALKFHPSYLAEHLVDGMELDNVLEEWIGNDE